MHRRLAITVVAGLLAMSGCSIDLSTANPQPVTSTAHRPTVGKPIVLDATVPGWETSAWLSKAAFCVRASRTEPQERKPNEMVYCDPAPTALKEDGPPLLPAKPLPYLDPADPQSEKIILVGTVRGVIDSVSVTMFGETATAPVHRLPEAEGRHVGAYAVWLPRSGPERDGMSQDDITAVAGHDETGAVVTRLGEEHT